MDLTACVQFHGRWDLESEDRYSTSWSGSSLNFQTTSRYVDIELGELTASRKNYHNILWQFGSQSLVRTLPVKGKRSLKITPSDQVEPDYTGDDLREVTIMLCDWGATLQILSISSADGQPITIKPSQGSTWPMLFIGASLVSGYSPPFRGLVLPYGTYQAFGSVLVRILRSHGVDARLEMVAYPGLPLTSGCYDSDGMVDIFWKGMNDRGGWESRSRDNPHDIFLCLGANDHGLYVEKDEFLKTYRNFLNRLKDSYPKGLKRIHVISPFGFFTDPTKPKKRKTIFEPEVQFMINELSEEWKNTRGPRLFHISTEGWIDKTLTCDGLHPTTEGHEVIGSKLVDYIASLDLEETD
ncbi:hypothetical protein Clacol_010581 [Clathrus columnatus]|uniref:SGNH hydrolase-type esterase domain-containing protein n=1 Tax=Clathrus columnatus TaxID=1419009 RepID=A0AAV5AQS4_9AGAM|nr:hypothetical protein Clacol_009003 [Clathrus columnatus]GJJ16285.1 hypothetical protein Clacol_010581 [Clathrus columnatus]